MTVFRLTPAMATHKGMRRRRNEDAVSYEYPYDADLLTRYGALFVVADGVGGLPQGEAAGERAVELLPKHYYEAAPDVSPATRLTQAVEQVNTDIFKELNRQGATTVVAAVVLGDTLITASVGDSLVYRVRDDIIERIGDDDVLANASDERGALTQAVGYRESVIVETVETTLATGDKFILCSDGLTRYVNEERLQRFADYQDPRDSVRRLVNAANEAGGADNISVIMIQVGEPLAPDAAVQHIKNRVIPVAIDSEPMMPQPVPNKQPTQVPQAPIEEEEPPPSPSTPSPIPRVNTSPSENATASPSTASDGRNWLLLAGIAVLLIGAALLLLALAFGGDDANTSAASTVAPTATTTMTAVPPTAPPATDAAAETLPAVAATSLQTSSVDSSIQQGNIIRLNESVLTSVRVGDDEVASFAAAPDTPYVVQDIYQPENADDAVWYRLLDDDTGQTGWVSAEDLPAYTIEQDDE